MNRIPHHQGRSARLAMIAGLMFATSTCLCADFSSYATMLQNNAARQANLNSQMFPLGVAPSAGSMNPATALRRLVLPQPEGPSNTTRSPLSIMKPTRSVAMTERSGVS